MVCEPAAMRRDGLNVEDLQSMPGQKRYQRAQMIITQMLVIDGVVLQRFDERQKIVVFRYENAILANKRHDAVNHGVNVRDVGKDIGGSDDFGWTEVILGLSRAFKPEKTHPGADAARIGVIGRARRFDAQHRMSAGHEIRQQCSVVGTDIHAEIVGSEIEHFGACFVQVGEIVAQDACAVRAVGITGGKQYVGIDLQADLNQTAIAAAQPFQRIGGLLFCDAADCRHGVHGRMEAKKDNGLQRAAAA
jgi:hypothetical protein